MQNQNTEDKTLSQVVDEFEQEEGIQNAPVSDSQSVVSNRGSLEPLLTLKLLHDLVNSLIFTNHYWKRNGYFSTY